MTQEDAERLSILLLQIMGKLNESAAFVQDRGTAEHWKAYRSAVGRAMGGVALELCEPLWERFPPLKPEYLGGSYRIDPEIYKPPFYDPE